MYASYYRRALARHEDKPEQYSHLGFLTGEVFGVKRGFASLSDKVWDRVPCSIHLRTYAPIYLRIADWVP